MSTHPQRRDVTTELTGTGQDPLGTALLASAENWRQHESAVRAQRLATDVWSVVRSRVVSLRVDPQDVDDVTSPPSRRVWLQITTRRCPPGKEPNLARVAGRNAAFDYFRRKRTDVLEASESIDGVSDESADSGWRAVMASLDSDELHHWLELALADLNPAPRSVMIAIFILEEAANEVAERRLDAELAKRSVDKTTLDEQTLAALRRTARNWVDNNVRLGKEALRAAWVAHQGKAGEA